MCKCASARRSCHARTVRRRFVRLLMRRPGENATARYQRQYRDANQRKRDIRKRHGVPPSMHRLFQTSHAFRHFAARVDYWIRSLSSSAGIVAEVYMGSKATKHRDCRRHTGNQITGGSGLGSGYRRRILALAKHRVKQEHKRTQVLSGRVGRAPTHRKKRLP
jgi:hypothetical protein